MDSLSQFGQIMLALGGIVVLILGLGFIAKRVQGTAGLMNGQLKVLESVHLGTKERVVLLQAGKQRLLVGVTATQITPLGELAEKQLELPQIDEPDANRDIEQSEVVVA
ncbi:MAG: flagellar biosynthetic protein FliO [Pseudomonadota bacterium]